MLQDHHWNLPKLPRENGSRWDSHSEPLHTGIPVFSNVPRVYKRGRMVKYHSEWVPNAQWILNFILQIWNIDFASADFEIFWSLDSDFRTREWSDRREISNLWHSKVLWPQFFRDFVCLVSSRRNSHYLVYVDFSPNFFWKFRVKIFEVCHMWGRVIGSSQKIYPG